MKIQAKSLLSSFGQGRLSGTQPRAAAAGSGTAGMAGMAGKAAAPNLQALAAESDGFALAEVDLQLRGEGELVGTRQSGLAQYRFAELPRDAELLERARRSSEWIAAEDPDLREPEHALIGTALTARYGTESAAPITA